MNDIKNVLRSTLERMGAEVPDLHPRLHLEADLGLESLMRMELATRLEKKLGIPVGDEIDGLETVGELLAYLEANAPSAEVATPVRIAS